MGQKLVVGPLTRGLRNDVVPFYVDNESFPVLVNAYQWRGRIKRKRGNKLYTRLQRFFDSTNASYQASSATIVLGNDGSGNGTGNLLTDFATLQTNATLVPGSITINDVTSGNVYTDPGKSGILVGAPSGSGTVNYATGDFVITGAAGDTVNVKFIYYPDLPVMGLEDFYANSAQFPGLIAFDTTYAYNIVTILQGTTYSVSFYKNPLTGTYPSYVQKTNETPVSWNGFDYQQFWSVNYQGALWVTNGIDVPFTGSTIGMQFRDVEEVSNIVVGPPATVQLKITGHGLVVGDFLFLNEFNLGVITGINFQTGYVITRVDADNVIVELPNATLGGAGGVTATGIAQYLTNRSDPTKDCIRFYDGDPTDGSATNPVLDGTKGWVNFMPPLSAKPFSIADTPADIYYLVGARTIVNFKDRLLFFAPVIQSSTGSPIYLRDTVIYSQNGTPYYTASFTNTPDATQDTPYNSGTVFNPILVPINQTSSAAAYLEDVTGFGGFLSSGLDMDIITVDPNEDVLIVGFTRRQTRLIYTGNDIVPFNFYVINSELGSGSTFSAITMDKGVITKGSRGFVLTSQVESRRIDLEIPDEVFQVNLFSNGSERVCAQRDYINEWIYFTYPSNTISYVYPNTTLQYNYRENSWATFYENYTTYGTLRLSTQFTWATVGDYYPTWNDWNVPWNYGATNSLQPKVIGGNQQGFVLIRDFGTTEESSLFIQDITNNIVTSPNHCLNASDFIVINGCLGTVGSVVNGNIFAVVFIDNNTFGIWNPNINIPSGLTYTGSGTITRMYIPFIQTRQFPTSWALARKTRIGFQQYLFTRTSEPNSQITLNIYLSQDAENNYNFGAIVPQTSSINNTLIYSAILYTSPEVYKQTCSNISLGSVGDGISLSYTFDYFQLFKIDFASLIPGSVFIQVGDVATFQDDGSGGFTVTGTGTSVGSSVNYLDGIITIAFTVAPTNEATTTNFQYYLTNLQAPTSASQSQIWHRMNTSLIGDTVQIGFTLSEQQMFDDTFSNQFSEIEIHGFILDLQPSQLLA